MAPAPAPAPAPAHQSEAEFRPTYSGIILSTLDAIILVEACLQGRLAHIPRRPHEKERSSEIRSGTIFIYEENASGIKRWTDGLTWSPSRIIGNFLIYRELVKRFPPGEKKRAAKRKRSQEGEDYVEVQATSQSPEESATRQPSIAQRMSPEEQRRLLGSLLDSYDFKENDGLVKKTISIKYKGSTHHVISYYSLEDALSRRLKQPTSDSDIMLCYPPRAELLNEQNFRVSPDESSDIIQYYPHHQPQMFMMPHSTTFASQYPSPNRQFRDSVVEHQFPGNTEVFPVEQSYHRPGVMVPLAPTGICAGNSAEFFPHEQFHHHRQAGMLPPLPPPPTGDENNFPATTGLSKPRDAPSNQTEALPDEHAYQVRTLGTFAPPVHTYAPIGMYPPPSGDYYSNPDVKSFEIGENGQSGENGENGLWTLQY